MNLPILETKRLKREHGASLVEAAIVLPLILLLISGGLFLAFVYLSVSYVDSELDRTLSDLAIQRTLHNPDGIVPVAGCENNDPNRDGIPDEPCSTVYTAILTLQDRLYTLFGNASENIMYLPETLPNNENNIKIFIPSLINNPADIPRYHEELKTTPLSAEATIFINLGFAGTYSLNRQSTVPRYAEEPATSGFGSLPRDCNGNAVGHPLYGDDPCACESPEVFNPTTHSCFLCPESVTVSVPNSGDITVSVLPSGSDSYNCQGPNGCFHSCKGRYTYLRCGDSTGECRCPSGYSIGLDSTMPSGRSCFCPGGDENNPGHVTNDSCKTLCPSAIPGDPCSTSGGGLGASLAIAASPPNGGTHSCECTCPPCLGGELGDPLTGCHCELATDCADPYVLNTDTNNCECKYTATNNPVSCPYGQRPKATGCECECDPSVPPRCGPGADNDGCDCFCPPGYIGNPYDLTNGCQDCESCPDGTTTVNVPGQFCPTCECGPCKIFIHSQWMCIEDISCTGGGS